MLFLRALFTESHRYPGRRHQAHVRDATRRSFPLPDYNLSDPGQVGVSIAGRILDERYTRFLMDQAELTLHQVILLDRIQKKQRLERDDYQLLKKPGLVEGSYVKPQRVKRMLEQLLASARRAFSK